MAEEYERNQELNRLVSWLHSLRYRDILPVVGRLAEDVGDRPIRLLDIGCAHARLFDVLRSRFPIEYTGIDPIPSMAEAARRRYGRHPRFEIVCDAVENRHDLLENRDAIVALETLEHIPEGAVVRLVEAIARARPRVFVLSVPVEVGPALWLKNLGSLLAGYYRHREYTWGETVWAGLGRLDKVPAHGLGHKGFDWRWLAATVRHNLALRELRRLPVNGLPIWLATSIFLVCEPRRPDPAAPRERSARR